MTYDEILEQNLNSRIATLIEYQRAYLSREGQDIHEYLQDLIASLGEIKRMIESYHRLSKAYCEEMADHYFAESAQSKAGGHVWIYYRARANAFLIVAAEIWKARIASLEENQ